jgi:Na+/H+-dicarboxylate symporter
MGRDIMIEETQQSAIGHQTFRLRSWIRNRLWAQVVTGLLAGMIAGLLLSDGLALVDHETAAIIGGWLSLPGKLFMGLISISLIPLVFISILQGLIAPKDPAVLRAVGLRLGALILTTTTAAAVLGVALTLWLNPGDYVDFSGVEAVEPAAGVAIDEEAVARMQAEQQLRLSDRIANLIPKDPFAAIADRDMLAIVILALMFGIACRQADQARIETFLGNLDGLLELAMLLVKWAMFLTPYAVFGLMAQLMAQVGVETVVGLSLYVATVLAGLVLLMIGYLVLVTLSRGNPFAFLRALTDVQVLAFSTSSSAAVMPLSIQTAINKLKVPASTADVVIPLGATMNMAGTALYQSVAVLFLAQISGIDITTPQIAIIVTTLVLSSIGAPGTPGVSVAILASVIAGLGIPPEGLVLVLGVDRLLDMCRTVVNVTGDLTAAFLLRGIGISLASQTSPEQSSISS